MTRVQCPVCHHSIRVTDDGLIAEHRMRLVWSTMRCPGSGRPASPTTD